MTSKVSLTDRSNEDYEPYMFERKAGPGRLSEAELIVAGRNADALVNQGVPITWCWSA